MPRSRVSPRALRRLLGLVACLGAAVIAVAEEPADPGEPTGAGEWDPERATVVYTSRASGNSDLWLRAGVAGEPIQLTDDAAQDHWVSWFPDGGRIAFQSLRGGQRDVWAMAVDGAGLVNLSDHPAQDLLPEVSPDGERILFFSDRGIEHGPRELPGNLYLMKADGSEIERLTAEPLTSTFVGTWSPDGRAVIFARNFDGDVDLVRLDLASGREERIPGTTAAEYGARYSPDGERIAFHATTGEGDEARIVVMSADGSGRHDVTRGGQHYEPHWSPDGHWLLFTGAPSGASQFDLLAVPAAGGTVRPVVATEVDERGGSWRPGS